ncbi:hypothetical protein [Clostridium sp.]|uniref:hypothetical protein n=1 Tax=Clostridium sp. TaxID=1506 RepID=UPI001A4DF430|nr:hypothetical protein [Clostridium sp.]MBK5241605.1 hypothetical protein [Clostridium sp.]
MFDKEGAEVILKITKAWADLFSNGPSTLNLTGPYSWNAAYGVTHGNYARIDINRDELVKKFRKLQLFSEKVISNKYFILHHGM